MQRLLKKGLGLSPSKGGSTPNEPDIKVLSVNSWTMHAQVADSFTNSHENVFLAGDAAHRFPPAGLHVFNLIIRCYLIISIQHFSAVTFI